MVSHQVAPALWVFFGSTCIRQNISQWTKTLQKKIKSHQRFIPPFCFLLYVFTVMCCAEEVPELPVLSWWIVQYFFPLLSCKQHIERHNDKFYSRPTHLFPALASPEPFKHMCLAFVAKQISPSLSYFYQARERLFFLSDRQCLGRIEWELESFIFQRLNNSRLITN